MAGFEYLLIVLIAAVCLNILTAGFRQSGELVAESLMEFVERPLSASHEVIGFVNVQFLHHRLIEHKASGEIKGRQRQVAHSEIERPSLPSLQEFRTF